MSIREYQPDTDFDGLRACVVELQNYEYEIDSRFPDGESIADEYIPDILDRCRKFDGKVLVVEVDGEIGGYVMVWTKYGTGDIEDGEFESGLLADLVVRERFRGQGIGSKLIRAGEDYAMSHGVKYLRLGVMAANQPARKLYAAHGYSEVGVELEKTLGRST